MNIELINYREKLAYKAIKNNEILDLMRGNGNYYYTDRYCSGPVDSMEVLDLLYAVDRYDKTLSICNLFESSLKTLIEGNTDDLYLAVVYFVNQLENETKKRSGFNLNENLRKIFLKELKKKIHTNEAKLKKEVTIYGLNKWRAMELKSNQLNRETDIKDNLI